MTMTSSDLLSVVAGVAIVIIIACVAHPGWFPQAAAPEESTPALTTTTPTPALQVPQTPAPTPAVLEQKLAYVRYPAKEYQISTIPENISYKGGSDPPWSESNISAFAYLEESHGGVTETFTVPYQVWRINCTLENGRKPESAGLTVLLVDAKENRIIDGAEIRGPGTIIKNIEISNRPFYLIVKTQNSDPFRITLETKTKYL